MAELGIADDATECPATPFDVVEITQPDDKLVVPFFEDDRQLDCLETVVVL